MPKKRPHKKAVRQKKFRRCPKCNRQVRVHQRRCRTCHWLLRKP